MARKVYGSQVLKPCPFCWSTAGLMSGGPGNHFVMCQNCKATSDDGSMERAIVLWNRRAGPEALTDKELTHASRLRESIAKRLRRGAKSQIRNLKP